MGASPKTKSDYRMKIADKQAALARERARICNDEQGKRNKKNNIASLQADIARLRAKMADAPNK